MFLPDRWELLKTSKDNLLLFILEACAPFLGPLQPERRDLVCLEVIGSSSIAEECSTFGPSMPYSDTYGPDQDILTEQGFAHLLTMALRVEEGGTVWFTPSTASWLPDSPSSSSRTSQCPGGNDKIGYISQANLQAQRCVIVGLVCWLRGVLLIESPLPPERWGRGARTIGGGRGGRMRMGGGLLAGR